MKENGVIGLMPTPDLHVIEYNDKIQLVDFKYDGSGKVTGVNCERSSAIPAPYDYQVLLAGYPFFIRAGERAAVLERVSGKYRLQLIQGANFNSEELKLVNERLSAYPLERPASEPILDSVESLPTHDTGTAKDAMPANLDRVARRTADEPIPECEGGHESALVDGAATIKPGETICLQLEARGNIVVPTSVITAYSPENTLVLRLWQENGETFLSLRNPLGGFLRYEASMLLPGQSQYQYTSSCPVLSHRLGIEQWPQVVDAIMLKNFKALPESETMNCQ
jgi:hypothetical protein